MADTIKSVYGKFFAEMAQKSAAASVVSENTSYEEANLETRKYGYKMISDYALPGSGLGNPEAFKALYDAVTKEGKRGLIMMEHLSNMDLPSIVYFLENYGEEWSTDMSKRIVAIAGKKLNETNVGVRAFAEAFSRVIVYPTRSLIDAQAKMETQEEKDAEAARAKKINFASMRAMNECSKRGQIILVFPSGTRYRPGVEETRRGLREMDSYLRIFDKMILVTMNGQCLHISEDNPNDMLADELTHEVVTLTASPLIDCKEFRQQSLENLPADCEDPKQKTVDDVMAYLRKQHDDVEKTRK